MRIGAIGNKRNRNGFARDEALKIDIFAREDRFSSGCDMAAASSSHAFGEPIAAVAWHLRADLGMGNVEGGAKLRKPHRIFYTANHIRKIAKQRESPRDHFQKFRAILKPRAINEAAGRRDTRKGVQRRNESVRGKSPAEPAFDEVVRAAKPARIQIVEKVGGERA